MSPQQMLPARRVETKKPSRLETRVLELYERHNADPDEDDFNISTAPFDVQNPVRKFLQLLETGEVRAAWHEGTASTGTTFVNPAVMAAINLLFPMEGMVSMEAGAVVWNDKIEVMTNHHEAGRRVVPGAIIRRFCYASVDAVYMPCFVNLAAYVGAGSMIDTWATVGSAAQIGNHVHLSGGVGIGGVLEPPGALPVIIGDDCFIGSRCVVVEGALIGTNATLGAGTILAANTVVRDIDGKMLARGVIPDNAVAVARPYVRGDESYEFGILDTHYGVRVIKYVEPGVRHSKTQLNGLLREAGETLG